jgi:hypothetical protein
MRSIIATNFGPTTSRKMRSLVRKAGPLTQIMYNSPVSWATNGAVIELVPMPKSNTDGVMLSQDFLTATFDSCL